MPALPRHPPPFTHRSKSSSYQKKRVNSNDLIVDDLLTARQNLPHLNRHFLVVPCHTQCLLCLSPSFKVSTLVQKNEMTKLPSPSKEQEQDHSLIFNFYSLVQAKPSKLYNQDIKFLFYRQEITYNAGFMIEGILSKRISFQEFMVMLKFNVTSSHYVTLSRNFFFPLKICLSFFYEKLC